MEVDYQEDDTIYKVVTSDNKEYDIRRSTIGRWETINEMLELFIDSDDQSNVIPLPNVSLEILQLIIIWDENHSFAKKNQPMPIVNDYGREHFDLNGGPRDFLTTINETKGKEVIFELIKAANYLQIPDLFRATCRFVAMELTARKTAENIKNYLGFPLTTNPSAEQLILRRNNLWCDKL